MRRAVSRTKKLSLSGGIFNSCGAFTTKCGFPAHGEPQLRPCGECAEPRRKQTYHLRVHTEVKRVAFPATRFHGPEAGGPSAFHAPSGRTEKPSIRSAREWRSS